MTLIVFVFIVSHKSTLKFISRLPVGVLYPTISTGFAMTSSCRHRSAIVLLAQNDSNHPASEGITTVGFGKSFAHYSQAVKHGGDTRVLAVCRHKYYGLLKIDAEVKEVEIWFASRFRFLSTYFHHPLCFLFLSRWPSSSLKRTPNHSRSLCNTITLLNDTNPSAPHPTKN